MIQKLDFVANSRTGATCWWKKCRKTYNDKKISEGDIPDFKQAFSIEKIKKLIFEKILDQCTRGKSSIWHKNRRLCFWVTRNKKFTGAILPWVGLF